MNKTILEYIWTDINNNFRSKVKVENYGNYLYPTVESLEIWNFDGSSTGQAYGHNSEIL